MKKIRLIRFAKSTFFRLNLYRIFSPFKGFYKNLTFITELGLWMNQHKRDFISNDYPIKGWVYERRYELYKEVNDYIYSDSPIIYLEFGVSKGESFKWWVENNQNSNSEFYGFDTFTGLPEDWNIFKAGDMSTKGEFPDIIDQRSRFIKGLFQDTLPNFIESTNFYKKRLVVHCDADLYSSTLYILTYLDRYLKPGDIILFDEYAVPTHEFLAYTNYIHSYRRLLKPLIAKNNYMFCAFEFIK